MPALDDHLYLSPAAVPRDGWRWKAGSPGELACRCRRHCAGEYFHDVETLDALERMRAIVGPLKINSGRRCRLHNKAVGGAPDSLHARRIAVDVSLAGKSRAAMGRAAVKAGFTGIGFGRTFIHVDMGRARRWTYPGATPLWVAALGFDPVADFRRFA